ncbi:hypothetical protein [Aquimarina algiphila]|uniref:hypothetical protein n=1 Tax=Aquimarina algiphila TaxID=2047982 RepID=UPI002330FFF6|nr:hypothetical protein [Aquimarina algiphila]
MIAENVYSIFKALSPSESKRFKEMLEKESKKAKKASRKAVQDLEFKNHCDAIVNDYLIRLKKKCQMELKKYNNQKN